MPRDIGFAASERFERTQALIERIRGSVAALQSIAARGQILLGESKKAIIDAEVQIGRTFGTLSPAENPAPDQVCPNCGRSKSLPRSITIRNSQRTILYACVVCQHRFHTRTEDPPVTWTGGTGPIFKDLI